MERKKVKKQIIKKTKPKKRESNKPNPTEDKKVNSRWDRIEGVNGKVVRFKQGDNEKRIEFLKKKNYKELYVGVDGDTLYFYYEIIE
jgi:hypothetical protein